MEPLTVMLTVEMEPERGGAHITYYKVKVIRQSNHAAIAREWARNYPGIGVQSEVAICALRNWLLYQQSSR